MSDHRDRRRPAMREPRPPAGADPARAPGDRPEKFWDDGAARSGRGLAQVLRRARAQARPAAPARRPERRHADRAARELGRPASPRATRIAAPHPPWRPTPRSTRACTPPASPRRRRSSSTTSPPSGWCRRWRGVGELRGRAAARPAQRLRRAEAWREMARQIRPGPLPHLEPETLRHARRQSEGVLALHPDDARERARAARGGGAPARSAEAARRDDADPRYWRERDPDFIARVTAGFARLYTR